jgi:HSP20 family protein
METIENEFTNALERILGPEEGWIGMEKFAPRSNLAETEIAYEVTVELPGMKPEEFNVELKNGELWITGEKKEEREEKGKAFHRVERRFGEFRRVYRLPAAVNREMVTAEYKDGLLRVVVPKVPEATAKRIAVTA